ncbi:Transglutaminase-like enzyme, putative cysteine protease [Verrucomicrobium sp. GAS474]|uniref:transglutaminase family protein n=1 Tax=Verrucomicrobium sp. GAS474 TaxID=1882831 RepID=UPI00087DB2EA|nr:transglutaminase family protein [Verrucomicrobium sp. GAS474]SDU13250.1 Transglutaminase-like enzyme, putative cysteine protease [Verrucomicrobium sp. GAS474]
MKILIQHRTTYRYSEEVSFGPHQIMMRPREGHDIHIEKSILEITPAHHIHWLRDVNGNCIARVDFTERADHLMIYSELVLQHYDSNPFDFQLDRAAATYPFIYPAGSKSELSAFTQILYPKDTAALVVYLDPFWKPGETVETMALLQALNHDINQNFRYQRRDEPGVQTPAQTLQLRSGSCRDFATLFVEACRSWGLAARFVSGYMLCDATEAGGASTHAWAEVYLPGAGWKGFDPTSGILSGGQYVATAVSRDPEKAMPIDGVYLGPKEAALGIEVDVHVSQYDLPPASRRGEAPLPIPVETKPLPVIGSRPL